MIRRLYRLPVADEGKLVAIVAQRGVSTLIVDVEPFVANWGAPSAEFAEGAVQLARSIAAGAPLISDIIFATNSHRTRPALPGVDELAITVVRAAGKPWRTKYIRGLPSPVAVVGDQIITDGLLAWRLDVAFLHVVPTVPMPWWPRLQTVIGRLLSPLLCKPLLGGQCDEQR